MTNVFLILVGVDKMDSASGMGAVEPYNSGKHN